MEAAADGLPGMAHTAHLIPENPAGEFWQFLPPARPSELDLDFLAFIQALEGEFQKQQRTRRVEAADRALLVRAETDPNGEPEAARRTVRTGAPCGRKTFARSSSTAIDGPASSSAGKLAVIRAPDGANLQFDHELTAAQARSIGIYRAQRSSPTQVTWDICPARPQPGGKIQVELAQLWGTVCPPVSGCRPPALTGGTGRGAGETGRSTGGVRAIHRLEQTLRGSGRREPAARETR